MERSRLMLDTSAYSALARGSAIIRDRLALADEVCLCPVVIGELLAGFRRGHREAENRRILADFLDLPEVAVVSLDEETSERYAVIADHLRRAGTPIPTNDLWIAASAMQHGLKILTTDRYFLHVSQVLTECVPP
jgi:tRNA(fMet)-specific endonuclease VapC